MTLCRRRNYTFQTFVCLLLGLGCAWLASSRSAQAQELEPRSYAASPAGVTFLGTAYAYSSGSIVLDPTLPIEDAEAEVHQLVPGVGHTFGLFGKLALVSGLVPVAWAEARGTVGEERRQVSRSGLADPRVKLSVNVIGNPAQTPQAFARTPRRTVIGGSLVATVPIGQHQGFRLINLGTNRWAFKPEVGVSVPRGHWDLDGYFGVWLFTSNPNFYPGGLMRTQDPLYTIQLHASYTFRPRLWLAGDSTWYTGGAMTVADGPPSSRTDNSRLGITLSLPVARSYSIKFAYSNGVAARTGTDFDTFTVAWQRLFIGR